MAPDTGPGIIVGTVGYMAPEQVRGQAVDHRTDIFALGAVIYEMVSGRRAFAGATPADTLSAILNSDPPDLVMDAAGVSPALDRIIRRCLEKEPARRFQSTRDLSFALDALGTRSSASAMAAVPEPPSRRGPALAIMVAAAFVAGGIVAWVAKAPANEARDEVAPLVRFEIPSNIGNPPWISVSPDGQSLAWGDTEPGGNGPRVKVKRLGNPTAILVESAAGAIDGEFRRDSRNLYIANRSALWSTDPEANTTTVFNQEPGGARDGSYRGIAVAPNDDVLAGLGGRIALFKSGASGPPTVLASPDAAVHRWYGHPQWLPGGDRFLYMAQRADTRTLEAFVRPVAGGTPAKLDLPPGTSRVIVDPSGALLYGRSGALVAQRFDWSALKAIGEPVTIASDTVTDSTSGTLVASISETGVLAYRSVGFAQMQFEWVDRAGRTVGRIGPPAPYQNFDLSSDGQRVVTLRRDGPRSSMWLLDGARGVNSQIDPGGNLSDPTFSPDGQRIAYRRGNNIVTQSVFGGEETKVADWSGYPDSWSRDGKYLAVGRPKGTDYELWAIRMDGTHEEMPLVTGVQATDEPRFSADGKWVAYHATVDTTPQVYVMPFPPTGERFQISASGGVQPRFRGDGHELFFLDLEGNMMSVDLPGGNPKQASPARVLFRSGITTSTTNNQFAVSADGQRLLLRRPVSGADEAPVNVILNWRQLLK